MYLRINQYNIHTHTRVVIINKLYENTRI